MTFNLETLKVTDGQRALAAYIRAETGKQVKPEQISLIDALRAEFRKDPARVAEREAVQAAARQRKQDNLDKTLAKARKLAESLGLDLSALDAPAEREPGEAEVKQVEESKVTPIAQARAKRDAKAKPEPTPAIVVPDAADGDDEGDFDFADSTDLTPVGGEPDDTSAIEVVEAVDQFEADPADDDPDDF